MSACCLHSVRCSWFKDEAAGPALGSGFQQGSSFVFAPGESRPDGKGVLLSDSIAFLLLTLQLLSKCAAQVAAS